MEEALLQTIQDLHRYTSNELDEVKAYLALISLGKQTVGELSRFDAISSQINLRFGMATMDERVEGIVLKIM